MRMRHMDSLVLLAAACLALIAAPAQAATLVHLESPDVSTVLMGGFELSASTTVSIEATGMRGSRNFGIEWAWGDTEISFGGDGDDEEDGLAAYAWILDSNTREAVWVMNYDDTERGSRSSLRETTDSIDLPAGRYEVYLGSSLGILGSVDQGIFERRSARRARDEAEEDLEACFVKVEAAGLSGSQVKSFEPNGRLEDSVVALTSVGDSELRRQGFDLDRARTLRLYGLMEYPRSSDDPADFGWIIDLSNGKRIWDMSDRRGRRAGGGSKNRVLDREITLESGRYLLCYGSDDSHAYGSFNVAPPHDPLAWGIQLADADGQGAKGISLFDPPARGKPAIDFARARDDEFFEQAFRVKNDTTVHVYALGEGVDDGWTWVDYGWIIDTRSGETVWEMDDRNTFPAGGAEKNRMFDGGVSLPAGDYVAYYVTDGSHAYDDWNSGSPFEPEAWGMQVFGKVELIDADEVARAEGVLVAITRVRDNERTRERFTLSERTEVEIYAIGEGIDGEMFDYAYLRVDGKRRPIWEMDYRDTEHAGGASKNRVVREVLTLDAGEYEIVYESDGSHSFGDWNDRRPDDPLHWGVTVRAKR